MTAVEERRYIRADGLPKVTGQARYAADLTLPGMLHAWLTSMLPNDGALAPPGEDPETPASLGRQQ